MMQTIDMIATVGFPIVCVLSMAGFVVALLKVYREQIDNITHEHKEEINQIMLTHKEESDKMTEAVNNNTVVLSRILEHVRSTEKDA